ncbi:arabinosylfuranosidase ArfA [Nonomuraea gerenzanensis]|uniref:non-reducing end alpha-L-arabinofuranosidase n=1 Tax=Nonomuraea gerenzanensis TaxID=93944 RepID=A0A1M4EI08_9ACTN|nr:alpha-N-arabinofuranosidase [Nonomuraea gerenzanensis]UBU10154.1 alpha-N-arabinofuranosidase [Nonomuraea gerenzanensis]SBO98529.1 Alpha-N-arabinofuranosidase [Nonomuraea gerenzanensis]
MHQARLTLDPAFKVAPVRRRTFGTFVEHLGRCVYTGIYEPGHPTADEDGFRRDVLDLTRELGVSTVRYPGGNFVSGYRWEDGIGPVAERPRRLDLAWHSTETNEVGVDEFVRWCRKAGVEPMMAVNLGTRGLAEALDLLEYANHPSGTTLSDLRVANGAKEPHDIRMWCLGNEMDGPWQTGHKTAREYGRLAAETARAMRMVDPKLELVACGSSSSSMPTFGSWEAEVLEETYDLVDYISCHAYYEEKDGDLGSFLASSTDMEYFIASVVATADHVGARLKSRKKINISFDEWNVWYLSRFHDAGTPQDWPVAPPLLEDHYNLADAVTFGGLLITLLRNSDRVTAASLAQLVNVIAPIVTEPGGRAWRQTTFHPFAQASRYAAGDVLRVEPHSPAYETKQHGEVPLLHAVATHSASQGTTLFAVNRSTDGPLSLEIDARALGGVRIVEASTLTDPDVYARNTADDPTRITPRPNGDVEADPLRVLLPPVSWNVIRLA